MIDELAREEEGEITRLRTREEGPDLIDLRWTFREMEKLAFLVKWVSGNDAFVPVFVFKWPRMEGKSAL